ncbi:DUF4097 family beta strand repeat-containing protein [Streptomyces sp. SP18CS02]|uniref:DUF4097 family beta strand repeat-containing protein n=1 Tax=Streptomyces sp. SP18CS02 TaxID=3002531 RepID=UPI002E77E8B3|nr:DUF4097 family beta strand repeat-containing protein [Streptomyces sp. SP18CS02]MEE1753564.1 DUF4097 family beta strand repeat-containing protein [Streptomyces sp. SP18CS02]
MPDFETPEPISVTVEFDVGSVRITASKRTDTVVEVVPSDSTEEADVRAAQQTKVSLTGGRLLVKGVRKRSLFGRSGSVDVTIGLPAGSDVQGTSAVGDFACEGVFGHCRLKTSVGHIQVEEASTAHLRTGHGDIRVERVEGETEAIGAGRIDIGRIGGTAVVKNGNGETTIGEVAGDLRVNASNGRISVDAVQAGIDAKSANGDIRVGEVVRGQAELQTAAGEVEIGIRRSTTAWLDVNTKLGKVRNSLDPSDGPGSSDETVKVRARTGIGDIVIRRSS